MLKINPIKSTALSIVVAAPLLSGCGNNNSSKTTNVNQTEVVSQGVSNAIKANAINTETISFDINKKLEARLKKCAIDEAERSELMQLIRDLSKQDGTFLATLDLQHYVDRGNMESALDHLAFWQHPLNKDEAFDPNYVANTKHEGYNVLEYNDKIKSWLDNEYFNYVASKEDENLYDRKITSGEKVSEFLDNFISESPYHKDSDRNRYKSEVLQFAQQHNSKNNVEDLAELIAFKTYLIDKLAFENQTVKSENLKYYRNDNINAFVGLYAPKGLEYFDSFIERYYEKPGKP